MALRQQDKSMVYASSELDSEASESGNESAATKEKSNFLDEHRLIILAKEAELRKARGCGKGRGRGSGDSNVGGQTDMEERDQGGMPHGKRGRQQRKKS